jgi:hypothetical protein
MGEFETVASVLIFIAAAEIAVGILFWRFPKQ